MDDDRRPDGTTMVTPRPPGPALLAALREGRGHDTWYDSTAPALYQYCWTLLGPGRVDEAPRSSGALRLDGASAAVWEAFAAATERFDDLADSAELTPWMFALARVACERRGLVRPSPYRSLPVVASERVLADALGQLPPSCRELLELSLRHRLSTAAMTRMLGLDAETVSQLTAAAARRAVDVLNEIDPAGPREHGWRVDDVPGAMGLLVPPLPPTALRAAVLGGCLDPGYAAARRRAAAALEPYGPDGFPTHQPRHGPDGEPLTAPASAPAGAAPTSDAEVDAEPESEENAAALDRVTTADTPARAVPEPVAELAADPDTDAAPDRASRWRWAAPVVAGLLTVVVALTIWFAGMVMGGDFPGGTIAEEPRQPGDPGFGADPSDHQHIPDVRESTGADAAEDRPDLALDTDELTPGEVPGAAGEAPEGSGEQSSGAAAEPPAPEGGVSGSEDADPAPGGGSGTTDDTGGGDLQQLSPAQDSGSDSGDAGDGGDSRGLLPTLFDGLVDLLTP